MMMKIYLLFFFALIILFSCERISSLDDGPILIDKHEIWKLSESPIVLDRDVQVTVSGKLEIEPGVIIKFIENSVNVPDPAGDLKRNPKIIVEGTLISEGDSNKMVEFIGSNSLNFKDSQIHIDAKNLIYDNSIVSWSKIGVIVWENGIVRLNNCTANSLHSFYNDSVFIVSNDIEYINVIDGKGLIKNNLTTNITVQRDSTVITTNEISNASGDLGGIKCANDSKAYISNNNIENCEIAIFIFSSTPQLIYNNITNNSLNFVILPELEKPQSDTIYATNNWWGTTDTTEIKNKIEYRKNGNTLSEKEIIYIPFSDNPF